MKTDISIHPDFQERVKKTWVKKIINEVSINFPEHKNDQVSIVFEKDDKLQELNSQYRGIEETTDVLSFEGGYLNPELNINFLGEIFISVPQADRQSHEAQSRLQDELSLLITHGLLHLLGYDHMSPEDQTIMWNKQDELLASIHSRIWYEEF